MTFSMRESYRVVVPDRFLTTAFIDGVVTVSTGEHVLVKTDHAVNLLEGDRAGVTYVPLDEIHDVTLKTSDTQYHCRWKGDATYYDVHIGSDEIVSDGAWAYHDAPDEIALLQTRIAFDSTLFDEQISPKESFE